MKNYFLGFVILVSTCVFAQDLNMDTIYVNTKNTSYLIFPKNIDLVDIGSPEEYGTQFQDNSVFLKATIAQAGISTILVKCGADYYFGVIKFELNNKKFMYDFKNKVLHVQNKQSQNSGGNVKAPVTNNNSGNNVVQVKEETRTTDTSSLGDIVQRFIKTPTEITTMGFVSDFIDAAVTVIRNDKDKTFLKFVVHNKSSLPYKLDFISFQYFQDQKKGFGNKAKKVGTDVFPIYVPAQGEVPPLKTMGLGYAIPSFALAGNGYLMVIFREAQGDRVLKIKITPEFLLGAKILENSVKNGQ